MNHDFSQTKFKELCEEYHIKFLVLFGSQASGKIHAESDFDIGIYPANGINTEQEAKLEAKLSILVGSPHVDLVNLKTAGPLLQKEAVTEGKLLYAQDKFSFPLFQMYAVRAYYDYQPYLALRAKAVGERIKKLSK